MADKLSNLTFTAPPDGGDPIDNYRAQVYEGDTLIDTWSGNPPFPLPHSTTVERTVVVQAHNAQGWSVPVQIILAPAEATTGDLPVAPTISGVVGDRQVTLTATGGTWDSITWWRGTNNRGLFGGNVTPYTDTGLTNGTTYDYYCKVYLGEGPGEAESNHLSLTPTATPTVTPVTITAVRNTSDPATKIDVAITNQGSGNWVQHAVLVNGSVWWNPATLPGTIEAQSANATQVQVRSTYQENGVNKTVLSNTVTVAAYNASAVVPPTIEYVASVDGGVRYRFTAIGSGYLVTEARADQNGLNVSADPAGAIPAVGEERVISGLQPGQTYDIRVLAVYQNPNNTYDSTPSNIITAMAGGFMGVAPTITAVPGNGEITVDVTNEGSGYTSYTLVVRDLEGEDDGTLGMVDFPYVASGLINGHQHIVGIIVTDADGNQSQSNIEYVTPLDVAQLPTLTTPTFGVSGQRFWNHIPAEPGGVLAFVAGYGGGISTPPALSYGSQAFTYLGAAMGQGATSRQIFAYWLPDPISGTQQISYDAGGSFTQAGGFSVDVLRAGDVQLIDAQGSASSTTQVIGSVYGATSDDLIVWAGVARSNNALVKLPYNAVAHTGSDGANIQAILASLRMTGDDSVGYNLDPADAASLIVLKIIGQGTGGGDEPVIG